MIWQCCDECQVSTQQWCDGCKVSTQQWCDDCQVSTQQWCDDCKVSTQQFCDDFQVAWLARQCVPRPLERVRYVLCSNSVCASSVERSRYVLCSNRVCALQLERVRYVLCSYLRCRLRKVERFTHHLLEKQAQLSDQANAILSSEELIFAKEWVTIRIIVLDSTC